MQQFIGREDWLDRFKNYLWQEEGVVWRITGQPGIGKSTLLRRFEHTCEHAERPNVWLDLENFTSAQGLEVLAAMASAARFFDTEKANKGWKEKAGEGFKTVSGGLIGVLELGKDLIPGGGLAVGAAKVLVGLGEGVAGSAAQISENAAAAHPELYLLDALAKAGEKHPVCLIDTYEHILRNDLKIQSRMVFGYGQAREGNAKTVSLSAWLADVFEYLKDKGWRIVMTGREVPRSKSDDQLPRFSRDEILQAAHIRPALAEYLPAQESAIASVLSTLSFDGNPLWLQVAMNLLENLLMEGKDLAQLAQQPEYLHECFETDDPFDTGAYDGIEHRRCKLTLISTLTRHISDLDDQAWKIALPRVLDKGIVMQLFAPQQANAILHNFKLAGVFRVTGQQFTLHEEIRDLLLAYARSKGWLDTDETRALHGKLWDYINWKYEPKAKEKLSALFMMATPIDMEGLKQKFSQHLEVEQVFPRLWMLEACYHRCLSSVWLIERGWLPRAFTNVLMGSAYLTSVDKWWIAQQLPELSIARISSIIEILDTEREQLKDLFGVQLTQQLLADIALGKAKNIMDVSYWEQRIGAVGSVGDYFGLIQVLVMGETDPVHLVQVVDEMFARHGDYIVPYEQEQCAFAMISKGRALADRLGDPRGAVVVYDSLLQRFGDSIVPSVQELCATTLYNKGWILANKLDDPIGSVAVCDSLLQHFGDSTIPSVQEECAKALLYKGVTLCQELNDPQGAVAVYDRLLQRFGDSAIPAVQELCAKALLYKGVTLCQELNDLQGAAAVYDSLLQRFGDSTIPAVQELCAKALVNEGLLGEKLDAKMLYSRKWTLNGKLTPLLSIAAYDSLLQRYGDSSVIGVQVQCAQALFKKSMRLGRMNDLAVAIISYDELLARYSQSENPAIQTQCQLALENMAELLLIMGRNAEAVQCIRQALVRTDAATIMRFLLWLAEADTTQNDVLIAIRALSPDVQFDWNWNDIRQLVDKLPEPRKIQAECFIAFFEQHHDITQLESCLWLPNQHEPNSA